MRLEAQAQAQDEKGDEDAVFVFRLSFFPPFLFCLFNIEGKFIFQCKLISQFERPRSISKRKGWGSVKGGDS